MPNRITEDMTWDEAIINVLEGNGVMHYKDIADAIVSRKLRKTTATPAQTVAARIATNIKRLGARSRFAKVGRGEFILKPSGITLPTPSLDNDDGGEAPTPGEADLLTAFGMNWRRELVVWSNTPNLYGQQQRGARKVNFSGQRGIYLLHDDRDVVYIGRAIDQTVGKRMSDHTTDRLNGRWNRFSWFGILPVREDGTIVDRAEVQTSVETIVRLMEALLIESIEPPLNRKKRRRHPSGGVHSSRRREDTEAAT